MALLFVPMVEPDQVAQQQENRNENHNHEKPKIVIVHC